jgi:division protein CdvB (Snf7/Vps24/ESCRT-III family)
MNKRMNLPNMQKILMEFEKQNERMEMTSDMMGDAIDDAMEVRRHISCRADSRLYRAASRL